MSRRRWWRRLLGHRLGGIGAVLAGLLLVAAIGAPVLARDDPLGMRMTEALAPPSASHWFGTDQFGRDEWARVLYGARLSFTVGLLSMLLATAVGMPLGAAAGYLGGPADAVTMRVMDAVLAFPAILLAIGLVAALGPGTGSGIVAIGIVYIPVLARVTRHQANTRRLIEVSHVVLVQLSLHVVLFIKSEVILSFLGFGVGVETVSWGSMLNEARQFMVVAPHVAVVPGAAISLAVLGINLLGDGMRDVLDPRLRA